MTNRVNLTKVKTKILERNSLQNSRSSTIPPDQKRFLETEEHWEQLTGNRYLIYILFQWLKLFKHFGKTCQHTCKTFDGTSKDFQKNIQSFPWNFEKLSKVWQNYQKTENFASFWGTWKNRKRVNLREIEPHFQKSLF